MTTRTFEHIFPDTGVKVTLRKVNPFMLQEARVSLMRQKPKPPVRIIQEEGPLMGTEEVMDDDEGYIETLRKWEGDIDQKIMELQIVRGVAKIEVEGWEEEVAQLRAQFTEMGIGTVLPRSDLVTYVTYIASGTGDDLQEFIMALAVRSQPTDEAVAAARDTF